MARYSADLHIHTVLSPCAEVEMIPPLIVARASEVGLDMIAVTDHNSAENVEAVIVAAQALSLKVLPGIECESVEGVHILCLFDEASQALGMQETVYAALPDLKNRPETFGAQFVVNAEGEFLRHNDRLLLAPTSLSIDEIVEATRSFNGTAIPAHIDRPTYGIYEALGLLPEEPHFGGVEISRNTSPDRAFGEYPDLCGRMVFCSSDAHRLEDIGSRRTVLELEHRTVREIRRLLE